MHYSWYLRIVSQTSPSAASEWTSELKIALSLSFAALRLHKRAAGWAIGGGHFRSKRLRPASDPQQPPVAVGEDRTQTHTHAHSTMQETFRCIPNIHTSASSESAYLSSTHQSLFFTFCHFWTHGISISLPLECINQCDTCNESHTNKPSKSSATDLTNNNSKSIPKFKCSNTNTFTQLKAIQTQHLEDTIYSLLCAVDQLIFVGSFEANSHPFILPQGLCVFIKFLLGRQVEERTNP